MLQLNAFSLYLVTDRQWLRGRQLENVVEDAILGGVRIVQLREKNISEALFIDRAKSILKVCRKYAVPLIINDNVNVAMLSGADGVHLGATDGDIISARVILGQDAIIGASARTLEGALSAQAQGADYLGVGAVFGTTTKDNAKTINLDTLRDICNHCSLPIFAIGGVNQTNISKLKDIPIAGVAVISAILNNDDITHATHKLIENNE